MKIILLLSTCFILSSFYQPIQAQNSDEDIFVNLVEELAQNVDVIPYLFVCKVDGKKNLIFEKDTAFFTIPTGIKLESDTNTIYLWPEKLIFNNFTQYWFKFTKISIANSSINAIYQSYSYTPQSDRVYIKGKVKYYLNQNNRWKIEKNTFKKVKYESPLSLK